MAEQVNMEQFDVAVPWNDIPDSDVVPDGRHVIRIKEFRLQQSGEGKLMAVMFSSVDEGPLAGVPFPIQNYVLGTQDDPMCQNDPKTWRTSFGGRELKKCLNACGTMQDDRSLRATLKRAEQARFQAYVTTAIQKEGEYAGTERNRITKYGVYGTEMMVPGAKQGAQGSAPTVNGTAPGASPGPRKRQRPGAQTEAPEEADGTAPANDDIPF